MSTVKCRVVGCDVGILGPCGRLDTLCIASCSLAASEEGMSGTFLRNLLMVGGRKAANIRASVGMQAVHRIWYQLICVSL